jgi:hypothetical protein
MFHWVKRVNSIKLICHNFKIMNFVNIRKRFSKIYLVVANVLGNFCEQIERFEG